MLDTSPPRGNAFVTPGNMSLPLSPTLALSRFLLFIHFFSRLLCPALFIPLRSCVTFDTEVQPSFPLLPSLSFGLVFLHRATPLTVW